MSFCRCMTCGGRGKAIFSKEAAVQSFENGSKGADKCESKEMILEPDSKWPWFCFIHFAEPLLPSKKFVYLIQGPKVHPMKPPVHETMPLFLYKKNNRTSAANPAQVNSFILLKMLIPAVHFQGGMPETPDRDIIWFTHKDQSGDLHQLKSTWTEVCTHTQFPPMNVHSM